MLIIPVVLIYLAIASIDIISMGKDRNKTKVAIYIITMIIPLVLSISLLSGVKFTSISTVISNIVSKVIGLK